MRRQGCGETGKVDNGVVGQHLLYSDNPPTSPFNSDNDPTNPFNSDNLPTNPFNAVLASDLFLPEEWSNDRARCRKAGIPDDVVHRPQWRIALDQLKRAMGNGVWFWFVTFDEDYDAVSNPSRARQEAFSREQAAGNRQQAIGNRQ